MVLPGEFDGGDGLGGGVDAADAAEFMVIEGLDAEREAVEAGVFDSFEERGFGGFGVNFDGGFEE
jgi:hypothetical protein